MADLDIADSTTVPVKIMGIELVALKKLSLVSHALAGKMGGSAGREQECLAGVLDGVIRQIDLGIALAAERRPENGPQSGGGRG